MSRTARVKEEVEGGRQDRACMCGVQSSQSILWLFTSHNIVDIVTTSESISFNTASDLYALSDIFPAHACVPTCMGKLVNQDRFSDGDNSGLLHLQASGPWVLRSKCEWIWQRQFSTRSSSHWFVRKLTSFHEGLCDTGCLCTTVTVPGRGFEMRMMQQEKVQDYSLSFRV